MSKPTVAVYKFSSCDGCQLSLLNLEDELLELAGAVEIAYFLEARRRVLPGPYDVGLVEGSVTTPHEVERILEIRSQVRFLVALGTCATAGGIQALRNFTNVDDLALKVYEYPEYLQVLEQGNADLAARQSRPGAVGLPGEQVPGVGSGCCTAAEPQAVPAGAQRVPGLQAERHCVRGSRHWASPAWDRSPAPAVGQSARPMDGAAMAVLARRRMLSSRLMPGC